MAELNIRVGRYGFEQLYWLEAIELECTGMWYALWQEQWSMDSGVGRLPDRAFDG